MARLDVLNILYAKKKSIKDFDWNKITAPPVLSILSPKDVYNIDLVCSDSAYDSRISERKGIINSILEPRGFKRMATGTNRVIYKFLEDQSFVLKASVSRAGLSDNPNEYRNQRCILPFCAKCHEVSPAGALGSFERVENIPTVQQYLDVAEDHFKLINDVILGKYIMADIGTKFYTNIGIRKGFGVIFVDYPLLYELDGNKLFCNCKNMFTGLPCGGQIDYDAGYNYLRCTKCGKQYLASRLAKDGYKDQIIVKRKENNNMVIEIKQGKEVIKNTQGFSGVDSYLDEVERKNTAELKKKKKNSHLVVEVYDPRCNLEKIAEHISEPNDDDDDTNTTESTTPVIEEPVNEDVAKSVVEETTDEKIEEVEPESVAEPVNEESAEEPKEEEEKTEERPVVPEIEKAVENNIPQEPINKEIKLNMYPEYNRKVETESHTESTAQQAYQSPTKITPPYPANIGRNMADNIEEEYDSYNNSKGYPAKKKSKKNKKRDKKFYDQY